jgi:hypothetical protein
MTSPKAARLIVDMSQMFSDRLRQVMSDCGDTAQRGGLDDEDVGKILITGLLVEVVMGTMHLEMDEKDYLAICLKARRELVKMLQTKKRPGPTVTA